MTILIGDRVRIIAECVGFLPPKLIGSEATVTKATAAGITVETDRLVGAFRTRYVPRGLAAECLERING